MDERSHAQVLLQQLSPLHLQALLGLMQGESVRGFARRFIIKGRKAADIREGMKFKLGVLRDADAVRIGLTAAVDRELENPAGSLAERPALAVGGDGRPVGKAGGTMICASVSAVSATKPLENPFARRVKGERGWHRISRGRGDVRCKASPSPA